MLLIEYKVGPRNECCTRRFVRGSTAVGGYPRGPDGTMVARDGRGTSRTYIGVFFVLLVHEPTLVGL